MKSEQTPATPGDVIRFQKEHRKGSDVGKSQANLVMGLGLIIQPRSHIPPRGWPECAGIRWVVGKKKIMEGNRKVSFALFAPLREGKFCRSLRSLCPILPLRSLRLCVSPVFFDLNGIFCYDAINFGFSLCLSRGFAFRLPKQQF